MEEKITQYGTEILLALISILAVYAKIWLNDLKKKAEAYYEARTTAAQRETLERLGKEAFAFAETAFKDLKGEEKLNTAITYFNEHAKELGLPISFSQARAAVEKAWLEDKRKVPFIELEEIKVARGTE